jgi:hypothetical protein
MSTYDNEINKKVAEAVSKIMTEQLKGDQHKIDANKNNKIDSHDFKLLRSRKKVATEETEQVEEGIEDRIEAAKAKAKSAGKTMKAPAASEKSRTTMVAGKAYGGAAQKDEPEDDDDDTMKSSKKGSFKRRYNTKMYKEQFSGLLESYLDGGLKSLMEDLEVIEEEPDNETFTKELEAQKEKAAGKGKKADVAAAAVQAVKNEEVDYLDEESHVIAKHGDVEVHRHESDEDGSVISVRKNGKKIADGDYDRHAGAFFVSHKSFGPGQKAFDSSKDLAHHFSTMKEEVDYIDELEFTIEDVESFMQTEEYQQLDELSKEKLSWYLKKATKHMDRKGSNMIKRDKKFNPGMNPLSRAIGGTSQRQDSIAQAAKKYLAKEEVELDERTLSSTEMETREKNVKGMKKNLSGFKDRYGSRAKEVIYATATQNAKDGK